METDYIQLMQELDIVEEEINYIETDYIEIFAEEESARRFLTLVETEEQEIQTIVTTVTKVFEEKTEIFNTVYKEAEVAIVNSNNKDKEVFDNQTFEAKEQKSIDTKKLTETLAAETQIAYQKAYNDEREAAVAKEAAAIKQEE